MSRTAPPAFRLLVLTTPANHHAPLLLRGLAGSLDEVKIGVVLSRRVGRSGIVAAALRHGVRYTAHKAFERLAIASRTRHERRKSLEVDKREFLPMLELVTRKGWDRHFTADINSAESMAWMHDWKPDLVVSLYFDQILRRPALAVAGRMPLNVHPSLLPSYAGTGPIFRALARGERRAGTTLHEMSEKVDEGRVVHRVAVEIEPDDTHFSLYRRCTMAALSPLLDYVRATRRGAEVRTAPRAPDLEPSYFSTSDSCARDLELFLRHGRRFI